MIDGKGKYSYSNGHTYHGEFWAGLKHGKGTMHDEDGDILHDGKWDYDIRDENPGKKNKKAQGSYGKAHTDEAPSDSDSDSPHKKASKRKSKRISGPTHNKKNSKHIPVKKKSTSDPTHNSEHSVIPGKESSMQVPRRKSSKKSANKSAKKSSKEKVQKEVQQEVKQEVQQEPGAVNDAVESESEAVNDAVNVAVNDAVNEAMSEDVGEDVSEGREEDVEDSEAKRFASQYRQLLEEDHHDNDHKIRKLPEEDNYRKSYHNRYSYQKALEASSKMEKERKSRAARESSKMEKERKSQGLQKTNSQEQQENTEQESRLDGVSKDGAVDFGGNKALEHRCGMPQTIPPVALPQQLQGSNRNNLVTNNLVTNNLVSNNLVTTQSGKTQSAEKENRVENNAFSFGLVSVRDSEDSLREEGARINKMLDSIPGIKHRESERRMKTLLKMGSPKKALQREELQAEKSAEPLFKQAREVGDVGSVSDSEKKNSAQENADERERPREVEKGREEREREEKERERERIKNEVLDSIPEMGYKEFERRMETLLEMGSPRDENAVEN
jgi:hypothetical protein